MLVYTPGVWDLFHVGHVHFLRRARELGDTLIVGVPSDEVVRQDKRHLPIIPLADRIAVLESVRYVTQVSTYYELEFLTHLHLYRPSVLAVGAEWGSADRHIDAEDWCKDNKCRLVRIPRYEGESSTEICNRILRRG